MRGSLQAAVAARVFGRRGSPALLSLDRSAARHGAAFWVRGRAREQLLKKRKTVKKEVTEGEGKLPSLPTLSQFGRD